MTSSRSQAPPQRGAYSIHLNIPNDLTLRIGSLGDIFLPSGDYVYIGSARSGIAARVARHRRLAELKTGKTHWHIDYLLIHSSVEMVRIDSHAGIQECAVAHRFASKPGASVPVPNFGSSDCRAGCAAHLFRLNV